MTKEGVRQTSTIKLQRKCVSIEWNTKKKKKTDYNKLTRNLLSVQRITFIYFLRLFSVSFILPLYKVLIHIYRLPRKRISSVHRYTHQSLSDLQESLIRSMSKLCFLLEIIGPVRRELFSSYVYMVRMFLFVMVYRE